MSDLIRYLYRDLNKASVTAKKGTSRSLGRARSKGLVRLTMFRLIELEDSRKEDMAAASGPDSLFWEMAEDREEAIQVKLAEQEIFRVAPGQELYVTPHPGGGTIRWDRGTPLPLAHGVPDAERTYLTQAERVLARAARSLLDGSEYLRRHPEMAEEARCWAAEERGTESVCPAHLEREPCPTCQSYIAAGL